MPTKKKSAPMPKKLRKLRKKNDKIWMRLSEEDREKIRWARVNNLCWEAEDIPLY